MTTKKTIYVTRTHAAKLMVQRAAARGISVSAAVKAIAADSTTPQPIHA